MKVGDKVRVVVHADTGSPESYDEIGEIRVVRRYDGPEFVLAALGDDLPLTYAERQLEVVKE